MWLCQCHLPMHPTCAQLELMRWCIIFIWNTRNIIFVKKFYSFLNVCNVLSELLGVETFFGSTGKHCALSILLLVLDSLCMSMGAGSLSRPFSKWSGHLSAAGEVLVLEQCWGDGCAPVRSLGVPPVPERTLLSAPPAAPTTSQLPWSHWSSSGGAASPGWPCAPAFPAPLSCPSAVCSRVLAPSQGTGETQDRGTLLFLSLQWAVWEGGRMELVGVTHFWGLKHHLL